MKIGLEDYLQNFDYSELKNEFAQCFVASASLMVDAFIIHILKCSASTLFAEEYFCQLKFTTDGEIIVQGYFWPKFIQEINKLLLEPDIDDNTIANAKKELIAQINRSISCTQNCRVLQAECFMGFLRILFSGKECW